MADQIVNGVEVVHSEMFYPPQEIVSQANVKDYESAYQESIRDPQAFWAREAEELEWFRKWDRVLDDSNAPFYQWFVGGKTNIVYNCLDRHLKTHRRNKEALIWVGEPGDERTFSYFALHRLVCKFANVLKSLGVKKGDIGYDLHATCAGADHRHVGQRQNRRRTQRRVRRL